MTIFDILHTDPPNSPITFNNGRFYAYKNILVDLHNEISIDELKPISQNNTLLNQLNISDNEYNIEHHHKYIPPDISKPGYHETVEIIIYKYIEIKIHNELYIKYYENENEIYIDHLTPTPNPLLKKHKRYNII